MLEIISNPPQSNPTCRKHGCVAKEKRLWWFGIWKKRRLDTSKKKCRGVPMSAVLKQIKGEIQPTLQHLILDIRHKHLLTWTHNIMTLDRFICSGECNPATPPRPKTPKTSSMHYSYTSARFSLTCESLDVLRGLLYRTLFEGHYRMWQDVIHSCYVPPLFCSE